MAFGMFEGLEDLISDQFGKAQTSTSPGSNAFRGALLAGIPTLGLGAPVGALIGAQVGLQNQQLEEQRRARQQQLEIDSASQFAQAQARVQRLQLIQPGRRFPSTGGDSASTTDQESALAGASSGAPSALSPATEVGSFSSGTF